MHRNFDILYWYSLLFEHLPDVLLGTGRNLGEVLRAVSDPEVARYMVAAVFRS
ncbi:MAG: hypothetical protein M3315_00310 [Actinomycetota bacterium]|nr:hypothetical protein [Actinomycetota bacterium]HZB82024.1 hypothetical protein [Rubrobacteraceae bacterium]